MKKILIQKFKKDEGFTGQDILIAIFITIAFLSLIVTMLINLSNTSYEINKTKQMTELISKMADKIDQMGYNDFQDTTEEKDTSEVSELRSYEIPNGITMKYKVSTEGDTNDPTKVITLIGTYKVNVADNTVRISIKKKNASGSDSGNNGNTGEDGYITPSIGSMYQYPFNIPKNSGNFEGEELIPVKFVWTAFYQDGKRGYWVTTTEDDKEWYSIEEGIYPTYVKASVSRVQRTFRMPDGTTKTYEIINQSIKPSGYGWHQQGGVDLYVWVPRIAGTEYYNGYAFETTNYEIVEQTGGGYVLKTTELSSYNESIFPSTARGVLVRYNRSNGFYGNSIVNALPYKTRSALNNFNRHDNEAQNQ